MPKEGLAVCINNLRQVRVRRARPADGPPLANDLLSVAMETRPEVVTPSADEIAGSIAPHLANPTSRLQFLVAEEGDDFVGHAVMSLQFGPELNSHYRFGHVYTRGGCRGHGVGRLVANDYQGIPLRSLLLPANQPGIHLGAAVGLQASGCHLATRTLTGDVIERFRGSCAVRTTPQGEIAFVLASNEAFQLSKADLSHTNQVFLVHGMMQLSRQDGGVAVSRRLVNRGVTTVLRSANPAPEDGSFYVLTRYHRSEEPVGFVWIYRSPSPFRKVPRVYAKLWLAEASRRMRLARPTVEGAIALFCKGERAVEMRGLLPSRRGPARAMWPVWEAICKSLSLEFQGARVLLGP
jgi:hypothetical protein